MRAASLLRHEPWVGTRHLQLVALLAASFALGCGSETSLDASADGDARASTCALRATEALVWPLGDEETPWFELHQQGTEPCRLTGAMARLEGAAGELIEQLLLPDGIAPEGVAVVRSQLVRRRSRQLPPRGRLVVYHGRNVLVHFDWGADGGAGGPTLGRAVALEPWDASIAPSWCTVQATPYDGANMGSPGEKNPGCDTCIASAGLLRRPRVRPGPGELELVALDVRFSGPNRGRQRAIVRSLAVGDRDVEGLELRVVVRNKAERRWRLLAPSCATLAPKQEAAIAVGSVLEPTAGRWLFSGPTLPQGDAVVSLLSQGQIVDEAVVPRAQLNTPAPALRDTDDVTPHDAQSAPAN